MTPSSPPPLHLAFIGMAGVGKSAISRRIAQMLGVDVVDIDAAVVDAAGRPIAEIFATDGEARFRQMETDALRAALERPDPTVIATGGGIVESHTNRDLLARRARVVLLHTTDAVLVERLRNSSNRRPLLEGDLEANLAALRQRRDHLYREVADLAVEVGFFDLTGTSGVVLAAIAERWPDTESQESPR